MSCFACDVAGDMAGDMAKAGRHVVNKASQMRRRPCVYGIWACCSILRLAKLSTRHNMRVRFAERTTRSLRSC